eukprot:81908-Pelagomonas_calceolata.AAC.2
MKQRFWGEGSPAPQQALDWGNDLYCIQGRSCTCMCCSVLHLVQLQHLCIPLGTFDTVLAIGSLV